MLQRYSLYENGTYNEIAEQHGGYLLGALFTLGTVAGVMGMFVSDMTTYAYQVRVRHKWVLASRLKTRGIAHESRVLHAARLL
eukprot:3174164-Rhodomonas_salina.1